AMALMRLMVGPIMGEWASIVEPTMVVQHIGMVVPATLMARGAARQPGTMVRAAPQVGAGGPVRGIMHRGVSRGSQAGRPRGWRLRERDRMARPQGLLGRRWFSRWRIPAMIDALQPRVQPWRAAIGYDAGGHFGFTGDRRRGC